MSKIRAFFVDLCSVMSYSHVCGKHLHEVTIAIRRGISEYTTGLTSPFFHLCACTKPGKWAVEVWNIPISQGQYNSSVYKKVTTFLSIWYIIFLFWMACSFDRIIKTLTFLKFCFVHVWTMCLMTVMSWWRKKTFTLCRSLLGYVLLTCMWKTFAWGHHCNKKGDFGIYNWFNLTIFSFMCLYQTRKVSSHVYVCYGYTICPFLQFSHWFWNCCL
jgi:hypothetical protein